MATPADSPAPEVQTPHADPAEAGAAAESPPSDPRRPTLVAGLEHEPLTLEELSTRIVNGFGAVTTDIVHGELTVHVTPEDLHALIAFCRDDEVVSTHMLSDLAGVHWPAGEHVIERQPATTGWPAYRVQRDRGVVEVNYILRSLERNHHFRVSVGVDDEQPHLPSVTDLFPTANFHEREVYDFFGVVFDGHPNMTRILMPDDWVGHPHRKDYPLGGVEIPYENDKFIPPPDERSMRDVIEGDYK